MKGKMAAAPEIIIWAWPSVSLCLNPRMISVIYSGDLVASF